MIVVFCFCVYECIWANVYVHGETKKEMSFVCGILCHHSVCWLFSGLCGSAVCAGKRVSRAGPTDPRRHMTRREKAAEDPDRRMAAAGVHCILCIAYCALCTVHCALWVANPWLCSFATL